MNHSKAVKQIKAAFKNVRLEGGVSLCQAGVMDDYGRGVTDEEFRSLTIGEVTDDWSSLPLATLDQYPFLAFVDAKGFRYYIPAFMLSVLTRYDSASMRVIGTLTALYPKKGSHWDYCMERYSLLTREQCSAIAGFLSDLPTLVELIPQHQKTVERALRNYWHEYL